MTTRTLSVGTMLGWGAGSLGTATLLNALTGLQLYFFVTLLGMSGTVAGLIIFVAKIYDLVTDAPMGVLSDRTRSRWGRRRPWMFVGALLCGLSFYLVFNPPHASALTLVWIECGLLFVYATGYTLFNIPYVALAGELSNDTNERARLMAFRVMFMQFGIAVGAAMAPGLVSYFGGGLPGYSRMALLIALVITLPMLIAVFASPEPPASSYANQSRERISFGLFAQQIRAATANRPFMVLMGVKLLHMIGVAASTGAMLFLIKSVLGKDEAYLGIRFGIPTLLGVLIFIPFWLAVSRRIGRRNTWMIVVCAFVVIVLSFLLATPTEPDWIFMTRAFLFGMCTAGNLLMAQAMLTDTMQYDREVHGGQREGLLSGIYSSVEKFAFAFAPLLVGVLLDLGGFDRAASTQTAAAERAIYLSAAVLPALVFALSLPVLRLYRLDEKQLGAQV